MKKAYVASICVWLFVPLGALADKPDGSMYLDGGDSGIGLVLAHGRGKHPTWLVVDPVRKGINEQLGYHTISLQMPTGYSDWKDYVDGFPEAYSRIAKAVAYLGNEKSVSTEREWGQVLVR